MGKHIHVNISHHVNNMYNHIDIFSVAFPTDSINFSHNEIKILGIPMRYVTRICMLMHDVRKGMCVFVCFFSRGN